MFDSGTLVLNKFNYDYMLNSNCKVSTQKLCSTYISVDSKHCPPTLPISFIILKCAVFLPVFEISVAVK